MSFINMDQSESDYNEPEYSISRNLLARMVAAHRSKMFNAIPEQEDYVNADAMIALLENRLSGNSQEREGS